MTLQNETQFHKYVRENALEYYPKLRKFAAYLMKDWGGDREELIHETVVAALSYRGVVRKSEIKILYRIMRNRFLMARDGTRIKSMLHGVKNGRESRYLEDKHHIKTRTEPVQENYVFVLEVLAGIEALSESAKEAIILAAEGHSPREIATILDIADGTAEARLSNGRSRLREHIGDTLCKKEIKNKAPYRGVMRSTTSNRNPWRARITVTEGGKKKRHNLGVFKTAEEAALIYDQAAIQHHGSQATLNFPDLIHRATEHSME